jgi:molybdenum cofactor guanylyltransferase
MGRDKAAIRTDPRDGQTLSERTAGLLRRATELALEVGPGFTSLDRVADSRPERGPLAALVDGTEDLRRRDWTGPVLVVATDLPRLTVEMLHWLAAYEPGVSVVPVANGRLQPLCARYEPGDLDRAAQLVASGERRMLELVSSISPRCVPEDVWGPYAGRPDCLVDVDTPEELAALGRSDP